MKKKFLISLISLLLVLPQLADLSAATTSAREFSPVQEGFVSSAPMVSPYATGHILVKFKAESMKNFNKDVTPQMGAALSGAQTGIASLDALGRAVGIVRISRPYIELKNKVEASRLGVDRWFMIELAEGSDIPDVVSRYAEDPNVEYAKPDWVAFPAVVPSDPFYADHWGHNNTAQLPDLDWGGTYDHTRSNTVGTPGFDANAQAAWDASQGFGSSSVIIAIIDTGVDMDHPDLNLVSGYDFGDNDSNPDDNSAAAGHGTCCAGVAAAMANNGRGACGAAPGCRVMPLKVANSSGSMYFSSIENAFYYAADNGADVISLSLGAYLSSDPATDAAITYAHNAGCVILAATSNDNDNVLSYPANHAYVIGVGAASPCGDRKRSSSSYSECNPGVSTDPNGYTCDGERWWGSNYGTNTKDAAGAVDILGPTILPTTDIVGSGGFRSGDYEPFFNGTSCATPYVAGVCALIKSANPTWTATQVRDQLVDSAIDIVNVESGSGWDRYSGYGMVDAAAAVGGGGPVAPVADFSGDPTSGTAPLTAYFTDLSSGSPTSWYWTFGDGGSSSQQNPNYTYNSAGTYTVTLTATNSVGSDGETKSGYITVNPCVAPTASFTAAPTSGYAPLAVSFTDQSTGSPTSWSWDFGDGGSSSQQNPSYTYTSTGTYTVTLTASNGCGSDDLVRSGYIAVTDDPGGTWVTITYDDFEGGMGSYTDGGGDMVLYTSGTYAHQGNNAADIQDNSGVASSFYHTASYNVSGYSELEVEFWFYAVSMDNTSEDFWVQYYDGSTWRTVATYARTTDFNNNTFYNKVVAIPAGTYNYATNAKIRFMCDASGNADDVYIDEIEFRGRTAGPVVPVAAFEGEPTSGIVPLTVTFTDQSTGSPTSWSWTFGDGGSSSQQNPEYTYNSAGTYTVALMVANAEGSDTETKTGYITVSPIPAPVAAFEASPTSGVVPLTVTFTDQSTGDIDSWSWNFGDGGGSSDQNPSHQYTAVGDYTVTLTVTGPGGSDDEVKTGYISVTEGGSWQVITYDDFESGMGNYTDGGGDMSLYSYGTYAHQGSRAADIQDNSGTASSFYHTNGYDVSGYTELEVEFWFYAVSMDRREDFWVQYYDGSTWRTVATFVRTTDFENNIFYNEVVTISSSQYNFPSNARLRFMCDASNNTDDVYIDEIEFRGIAGGTSGGSSPAIADEKPATPTTFTLYQNYPNPFNPVTRISFYLVEPAHVRLDVFNVAGAKVATLINESRGSGLHTVDFQASSLSSGIYLYRIIAGNKTEYKKMVLLR